MIASQFQQFMQAMMSGINGAHLGNNKDGDRNGDASRSRVILEERYFRRVREFEGDPKFYRSWLFDLLVAIGSIDSNLASGLEHLVGRD